MQKLEGAHVQCMNNHYPKFEYLGMKTFGVEITQTRHPLSILQKKMTKFKTPKNEKKIHEMYTN